MLSTSLPTTVAQKPCSDCDVMIHKSTHAGLCGRPEVDVAPVTKHALLLLLTLWTKQLPTEAPILDHTNKDINVRLTYEVIGQTVLIFYFFSYLTRTSWILGTANNARSSELKESKRGNKYLT